MICKYQMYYIWDADVDALKQKSSRKTFSVLGLELNAAGPTLSVEAHGDSAPMWSWWLHTCMKLLGCPCTQWNGAWRFYWPKINLSGRAYPCSTNKLHQSNVCIVVRAGRVRAMFGMSVEQVGNVCSQRGSCALEAQFRANKFPPQKNLFCQNPSSLLSLGVSFNQYTNPLGDWLFCADIIFK